MKVQANEFAVPTKIRDRKQRGLWPVSKHSSTGCTVMQCWQTSSSSLPKASPLICFLTKSQVKCCWLHDRLSLYSCTSVHLIPTVSNPSHHQTIDHVSNSQLINIKAQLKGTSVKAEALTRCVSAVICQATWELSCDLGVGHRTVPMELCLS